MENLTETHRGWEPSMTAAERHEQARRLSDSYRKASRKEKSLILSAFCESTGLNRKYAIGLLRNPPERRSRAGEKDRRRAARCSAETTQVLEAIWRAADYPSSVRLKALIPYWLPLVKKRMKVTAEMEAKLVAISPRTIDRRLDPVRTAAMRSDGRRLNRRENILRTTAHLFLQRGFETTSMNDIAQANSISKPGLYYHFENKKALLGAIIDLAHDQIDTEVEEILATSTGSEERLRRVIHALALRLTRVDDAAFSILAVEELNSLLPEDGTRTAQRKRAYVGAIKGFLNGIKAEGRLEEVDTTAAANSIIGLVMWIPKWYRPGGRLSAEQAAEEVTNLVMQSVLKHRGEKPARWPPKARAGTRKGE
jgi:AcrR family transcriptional regulator